jgi:hypothetical protein
MRRGKIWGKIWRIIPKCFRILWTYGPGNCVCLQKMSIDTRWYKEHHIHHFFANFPHGNRGCFSDLCQFTQRSMSCSQLRFLTQGTQCCKSASQRPVHQEFLQWIEEKKGILLQNMWISGLQPSCFGGFPVLNIGEFLTQRCTMLIYAAGWQFVGNIQTRVCAKFFSWTKILRVITAMAFQGIYSEIRIFWHMIWHIFRHST